MSSSSASPGARSCGCSWARCSATRSGRPHWQEIRAAALAVAAAAQWLANFLVSTTFPALANIGLTFAYGLYTAFAVLSFFFVIRWVHETKGQELEAMDDRVGRSNRAAAVPPRSAPEAQPRTPTSGPDRP